MGNAAGQKAKYVGPLKTVEECRREMARVYRDLRTAQQGSVTVAEGYQLTMMLVQIVKVIESGDLEARVEALEAAQSAAPARRRLGVVG
jgi:hypothetical protein